MNITNNYFWKHTSEENIANNPELKNLLSFKFYLKDIGINHTHIYLILNQDNKNIFFHGISYKHRGLLILDGTYSGFIIPNSSKSFYIKNSLNINQKLSSFLRNNNFSMLRIKPSPLQIYLNDSTIAHQLRFKGLKHTNGYLIIDKNNFNISSYNLRREIKIGISNLQNYLTINENHPECLFYLKKLLDKDLKQKIDLNYIEHIFQNAKKGFFSITILIKEEDLACVLIISKSYGMSSQTYNYSSEKFKKDFINKALHFKIINEIFEIKSSKIFVFGDSIDENNGMKSVTNFKQSFSENSLISAEIDHPLTISSKVYNIIKFLKKIVKV
jgi:hypothetical protein|tara:strand:+ start:3998 stop:4984 length:987 start_codon:yes stop_codon:yes gene_type:complete